MNNQVIITGGTGLVGSSLLDILLADDEIEKVVSLVRRKTTRDHEKLEEIETDFDHLHEYTNVIKGDAFFCCLGTTLKKAKSKENFKRVDYLYPFELAKIARENLVPQYNLISAMGADKSSIFFYNRVKGEIEEALQFLNFESLNIFRPSLLIGDRKENRVGEKAGILLAKVINPVLVGALKKYRGIDAGDVAMAMYDTFKNFEKGFHIIQSDEMYEIAQNQVTSR